MPVTALLSSIALDLAETAFKCLISMTSEALKVDILSTSRTVPQFPGQGSFPVEYNNCAPCILIGPYTVSEFGELLHLLLPCIHNYVRTCGRFHNSSCSIASE